MNSKDERQDVKRLTSHVPQEPRARPKCSCGSTHQARVRHFRKHIAPTIQYSWNLCIRQLTSIRPRCPPESCRNRRHACDNRQSRRHWTRSLPRISSSHKPTSDVHCFQDCRSARQCQVRRGKGRGYSGLDAFVEAEYYWRCTFTTYLRSH